MAVKKIGKYDLIICGKQAIDGDTAQVGPGLAEKLGIPHTTYVRKIEEIREGYMRCQRMTDAGYEVIEMTLPALVTVVKEINEPRMPSLKNMMRAKKADIPVWTAENIGVTEAVAGLMVPYPRYQDIRPQHTVDNEMIEGTRHPS